MIQLAPSYFGDVSPNSRLINNLTQKRRQVLYQVLRPKPLSILARIPRGRPSKESLLFRPRFGTSDTPCTLVVVRLSCAEIPVCRLITASFKYSEPVLFGFYSTDGQSVWLSQDANCAFAGRINLFSESGSFLVLDVVCRSCKCKPIVG